jgi:hypothetical protein
LLAEIVARLHVMPSVLVRTLFTGLAAKASATATKRSDPDGPPNATLRQLIVDEPAAVRESHDMPSALVMTAPVPTLTKSRLAAGPPYTTEYHWRSGVADKRRVHTPNPSATNDLLKGPWAALIIWAVSAASWRDSLSERASKPACFCRPVADNSKIGSKTIHDATFILT